MLNIEADLLWTVFCQRCVLGTEAYSHSTTTTTTTNNNNNGNL